jgi:hypothetical protein
MEPAGTGGGGWTCKQFTDLFFPCDANELQSVYDGIAGNKHWDFIGITAELNKQMKGSVSRASPDIQSNTSHASFVLAPLLRFMA